MRGFDLWVVGGDQRQLRLVELLAEDGHTVHTYALDWEAEPASTVLAAQSLKGMGRADCVILPLPALGEGGTLNAPLCREGVPVEAVLDAMTPGQLLVGGRLDAAFLEKAQSRGLRCQDYFAREELAVANAVPTAEGVGHGTLYITRYSPRWQARTAGKTFLRQNDENREGKAALY